MEFLADPRIRQQGSYFCLRLPHHQVIGIDANWTGRKRFEDDRCRAWLQDRLREGEGRTNILLTGNAPYVYGSSSPTRLLRDLEFVLEQNHVNLWFWGDNHYGAVFDRQANRAPFIGSCIGHGGYPGTRRTWAKGRSKASFAPPIWVETEPRFPGGMLRPSRGNNGWCELTLVPGGGVELLYVDWLGCKRFAVELVRERNLFWHYLRKGCSKTFYRGEQLHRPRGELP